MRQVGIAETPNPLSQESYNRAILVAKGIKFQKTEPQADERDNRGVEKTNCR